MARSFAFVSFPLAALIAMAVLLPADVSAAPEPAAMAQSGIGQLQIISTSSPLVPGQVGRINSVDITGATPFGQIELYIGYWVGFVHIYGCPGFHIDTYPHWVIRGTANANGDVMFHRFVPRRLSGVRVFIQAVDRAACSSTDMAWHDFP